MITKSTVVNGGAIVFNIAVHHNLKENSPPDIINLFRVSSNKNTTVSVSIVVFLYLTQNTFCSYLLTDDITHATSEDNRTWLFSYIVSVICICFNHCRSPPSGFWNLFTFQNFGGKHGSERFLFIHRWETR